MTVYSFLMWTILSTNKECWLQRADFLCLHHFQSWLTDFYLRWLSFFESDQIRYISCYSNDVGVTKRLSSTTRSRKLAVRRQLTESLKSAYLHHGVSPQNWTDALLENWCFTAEKTSQTHENEKKKPPCASCLIRKNSDYNWHIWHSLNVWPFRLDLTTNGLCKSISSERLLKTLSLEWRDKALVLSLAHTIHFFLNEHSPLWWECQIFPRTWEWMYWSHYCRECYLMVFSPTFEGKVQYWGFP